MHLCTASTANYLIHAVLHTLHLLLAILAQTVPGVFCVATLYVANETNVCELATLPKMAPAIVRIEHVACFNAARILLCCRSPRPLGWWRRAIRPLLCGFPLPPTCPLRLIRIRETFRCLNLLRQQDGSDMAALQDLHPAAIFPQYRSPRK